MPSDGATSEEAETSSDMSDGEESWLSRTHQDGYDMRRLGSAGRIHMVCELRMLMPDG